MTTAEVGSSVYVNGKMSAIVIEAEMPGRAPPMIPQIKPAMAAGISGVLTRRVKARVRSSTAAPLQKSHEAG
jgi:hypothetical protein